MIRQQRTKPVTETMQECLEEKRIILKSCREIKKKKEKLLDIEIMCLWELPRAVLSRAFNPISICHSFLKGWISLLSDCSQIFSLG